MKRCYLPNRRLAKMPAVKTKARLLWRRLQHQKFIGVFFRRHVPAPGKRRGVDLAELFADFDTIPDEGAAYFIRLCAVLPVITDPTASMNFSGVLKAGHGYLVLGKAQGEDSVARAFGFYPAMQMSLWSPLAPYPSMIRNDRRKQPHAFLEKQISALDFEVVRTLAMAGAWTGYDLLHFNCAGYVLEVFNSISAEPLVPPTYPVQWMGVPIGYNRLPSRRQIIIPYTPQGLFLAIRTLAMAGAPGAYITTAVGGSLR